MRRTMNDSEVLQNILSSVSSEAPMGSPCEESSTTAPPMEGRVKRRKVRGTRESQCPVCGISLRAGEAESHFELEINKLVRIPQRRPLSQRRASSSTSSSGAVDEAGPSTSGSSSGTPGSSNSRDNISSRLKGRLVRKGAEWVQYNTIKSNRQSRIRQMRRRAGMTDGEDYPDDLSDGRECPVCDKLFPVEDIQRHIERCLRQAEAEFEDEDVDIEGSDDENGPYEEYEWCGVTRVRATTLLRAEGQLHAIGTKVERGDEDDMVDVCDDDDIRFGPSQYKDDDVHQLNHLENEDNDPNRHHPDEIDVMESSSYQDGAQNSTQDSASRLTNSLGASPFHNDFEESAVTSSVAGGLEERLNPPVIPENDHIEATDFNTKHSRSPSSIENTIPENENLIDTGENIDRERRISEGQGQGLAGDAGLSRRVRNKSGTAVVEALRVRVRELEEERNRGRYMCRVCHGEYEKPVVSVSCWHVHCETCWLQALNAKKLCPQCCVITTTSDLRRVYL